MFRKYNAITKMCHLHWSISPRSRTFKKRSITYIYFSRFSFIYFFLMCLWVGGTDLINTDIYKVKVLLTPVFVRRFQTIKNDLTFEQF